MKLIDLSSLLEYPIRAEHYDKENGNEHFINGIESVLEYAENLPIVDAEPVTDGEWVSDKADVLFHCSVCGAQISTEWDYEDAWNYCPACGARMCGHYEI